MSDSPFKKDVQEKIAVCEAFGLSYWADHPEAGRMWAVDDNQQAHVIRWYKSKGYARMQGSGGRLVNSSVYPYRPIQGLYATHDVGERVAVAV